jgi:two-component system NtrC family response regulator
MDNDRLKILIVDDEPNIRSGLEMGLATEASKIETAEDGEAGWEKFCLTGHEIVVTDLRLPGEIDGLALTEKIRDKRPETRVIVITAFGTIETAVRAMRLGAYDFVTKPVDLDLLRHQVRKASEHHRLVLENQRLRELLGEAGEDLEIIGNCSATQELLRQVRQVGATDATVLIHGESGTGKELTARAIHRFSSRADKPFVTVNLGALPETLLESELFGYEKGAFTGALRQKTGRFENASGGTLFLDEITETSQKSQVDLLRVLEEQEFQRLGGEKTLTADVRVVSATNRDIEQLVADGDFREDLYYRLNVVPLHIPPLRARRDDVPVLIEHFLGHFCQRHKRDPKQLTNEAVQVLTSHSWPGNIRQLRNLMERLVVTVSSDVIHTEDLPADMRSRLDHTPGTLAAAVEDAEKQAILSALSASDNHREKTAKLLDVSVRTLHYKMSRYGLH